MPLDLTDETEEREFFDELTLDEAAAAIVTHEAGVDGPLAFETLIDSGLLAWINKRAFHHLGYALAFDRDEDTGEVRGFQVVGDGSEPMWLTQEGADKAAAARSLLSPSGPLAEHRAQARAAGGSIGGHPDY